MPRFEHIVDSTIAGFRHSLQRHMPSGASRDFNLWALSKGDNPSYSEWMQIIGIPQFAKLTEKLLGNAVSDACWDELVNYANIMNAYLIYETVSDNLAFGLAEPREDDEDYEARRQVLVAFNHAMIARLQGKRDEATSIMYSIKPLTASLSIFKYSMTETHQKSVVERFLASPSGQPYQMRDVEYGVWNILMANIDACVEVVESLYGFMLQSLLREGLIRRYSAVNDLLCHTVSDRNMLVHVSTDTILVIPVLTYYIAVIGERLNPNPLLGRVFESGVLRQSLEDAALMVRLLNDIGTNLVATAEHHRTLLNGLYARVSVAQNTDTTQFSRVLLNHSKDADFMTRIRKDLSFGEFNVSLHDLMTAPGDVMSLLLFGDNLMYFSQQYALRDTRLNDNLHVMSAILGDKTYSALIRDFVNFHAYIYQYQFDKQAGDYAAPPDQPTLDNPSHAPS